MSVDSLEARAVPDFKDLELIRKQLRGRGRPSHGGRRSGGPPGRHQHRRDDAGVGVLPAQAPKTSRWTPTRGCSTEDGEARLRDARAHGRQLPGDRLGSCARAPAPVARPRRRPRSGRASSLVVAASFAPIHERNNINLGQLMGDLRATEVRLQRRRVDRAGGVLRAATTRVTQALILESGGLFAFAKPRRRRARCEVPLPADDPQRPMTMAEKIIASSPRRRRGQGPRYVKPGDSVPREGRRRLQPRVHDRAGASTSCRTSTARTTAVVRTRRSSRSSKTTCCTPTACRRWRRSRPDPDPARPAERVPGPHRRARLLNAKSTACRPASATRSPASSSSTPATSSRRLTRTPAWAAGRTRCPGASVPPSTRA